MKVLVFLLGLLVAGPALADDPPGRVGRLSHVSGEVSVRGEEGWIEAPVNRPVSSGDSIATGTDGRAEIQVGSTALWLDRGALLGVTRLDDAETELNLTRGTLVVRVRGFYSGDSYRVSTPGGAVALLAAGRYRVDVGDDGVRVSVAEGQAMLEAGRSIIDVKGGESAEALSGRIVSGPRSWVPDGFDAWSAGRDRVVEAPPYVSPEMTGYGDLATYGNWREEPTYGPVWYPYGVSAGWAPYQDGRWTWVPAWGWTWVDFAPWGFAPFHYGRWAFIGGRWGWTPGAFVRRPVFAPALVGFVKPPHRVPRGAFPYHGWFPLGPREPFVPSFPCSALCAGRINAPHGAGAATALSPGGNVNRHAMVTLTPQGTLAGGRPFPGGPAGTMPSFAGTVPPALLVPRLKPLPVHEALRAPAPAPLPGPLTPPYEIRKPGLSAPPVPAPHVSGPHLPPPVPGIPAISAPYRGMPPSPAFVGGRALTGPPLSAPAPGPGKGPAPVRGGGPWGMSR